MSLPHVYSDLQGKFMDRGLFSSVQMRLAARSRVTNLGVALLAIALAISVLLNMRHTTRIVTEPVVQNTGIECPERFRNMRAVLPILPGHDKVKLTHLVVVAGHAIWKGNTGSSVTDDANWFLEEYQRGGSVNTFVQHIETGYVRLPLLTQRQHRRERQRKPPRIQRRANARARVVVRGRVVLPPRAHALALLAAQVAAACSRSPPAQVGLPAAVCRQLPEQCRRAIGDGVTRP